MPMFYFAIEDTVTSPRSGVAIFFNVFLLHKTIWGKELFRLKLLRLGSESFRDLLVEETNSCPSPERELQEFSATVKAVSRLLYT